MVVHIVHRTAARTQDSSGILTPGEGLISSDELIPVEETIHAIHSDEEKARNECAALNKTADDEQIERYGEVHDSLTWTITSMLVENHAAGPPKQNAEA